MHRTTPQFWKRFYKIDDATQKLARKNFELLKQNPRYPSLHFKEVNGYWSARVGLYYRVLAIGDGDDYIWVWIGSHPEIRQAYFLTPSKEHLYILTEQEKDKVMTHESYKGQVEFDDEAGIFHGEVLDLRDVVTFQGKTVDELKRAFQDSVDDYLEFCEARGEEPDKPFSGRLMLRLPPELHRKVYTSSKLEGKSLNQWIAEQLEAS